MSAHHQPALFDAPKIQHKQTVESILECLDSIRTINAGGCGISALAIYRWHKKNGIEVSDRPFRFLWDWDEEWEARRNDSHLFNDDLDSVQVPSHIVIELEDGLYDSTGLYDPASEGEYEQEYYLDENELLYVINHQPHDEPGGWNMTFKRAKYIPVIEYALGIDLSDVKR